MKSIALLITFIIYSFVSFGQHEDDRTINFPKSIELVNKVPNKENVWVFILAGQSNMAGRAFVEPMDTISNKRILSLNRTGQLVYAKEPLHFYEPSYTGLDCGLSFAKNLIRNIPDGITILLIPTAVGGSSVSQWLSDSTHRDVKLLTNFQSKVEIAKNYGNIKGILWHQGESDTNPIGISTYEEKLSSLFEVFRTISGNKNLPILAGKIGSYSNDKENWNLINEKIQAVAKQNSDIYIISTSDLKDKGDKVHFDSESQRKMGERLAVKFMSTVK
ncbi:sialate O-acetylesterase [Flavobacterium sp.]|uniref:sialate O-acetylesterase n=1 Tax=Flavobacterium sp. TaxID=239 RepID=UPI00286DA77C|nr:sialate O-acetylesterase [Flavobacterium sp.]